MDMQIVMMIMTILMRMMMVRMMMKIFELSYLAKDPRHRDLAPRGEMGRAHTDMQFLEYKSSSSSDTDTDMKFL